VRLTSVMILIKAHHVLTTPLALMKTMTRNVMAERILQVINRFLMALTAVAGIWHQESVIVLKV